VYSRDSIQGILRINAHKGLCLVAVIVTMAFAINADPRVSNIVALGASNTRGKGVDPGKAYPAQLEAMLKSKGYHVRVINAGLDGVPTLGMLQRLDTAVPNDTESRNSLSISQRFTAWIARTTNSMRS
jgi:lysophospholipase L1-like esterase